MTIPPDVKKRVEFLRNEINKHNYYYYIENNPIISDFEYDNLFKELKELEEKYPELYDPNSPTQRIGSKPAEEFAEVEHRIPMLSLENAFSIEELLDFNNRVLRLLDNPELKEIEYVVEPKLDGLGVELIYKNGSLIQASTRGDGKIGEDVTLNIKTIKQVPLKLFLPASSPEYEQDKTIVKGAVSNFPEILEVRGEVIIEKKAFDEYNKERIKKGEITYANPRNLASGSLRQLDPRITASRPLSIFIYELSYVEGIEISNHFDSLKFLKKIGFRINPNIYLCKGIQETIEKCKFLESKRYDLPYETDGSVVKVNSYELRNKIGYVSHHPRWAIAFKYPAEEVTTIVEDVVWSVGRTGLVTPTAILKPVFVSGVTISKATLHNYKELKRKDVRICDTVFIRRAGEVIPEVIKVVKEKRTGKELEVKMPEKCPVCNSLLVVDPGGILIYCPNAQCPKQIHEKLVHFASRNAMNIEGLGTKQVERFIELGWLKSFSDIYRLKEKPISSLDRMGEKSASNLINSIEKSKNAPFNKLLFALGIKHVGRYISNLIAKHYPDWQSLSRTTEEELLSIHEIGPEIAKSIVSFFKNEDNINVLKELEELGVISKEKIDIKTPSSKKLANKVFLFTGELEHFTREEAHQKVIELGGEFASSISKKVDYLVVGKNPGSKLTKAQKLGIKTIDEKEFIDLISKS